jgi:hypothetical protein
MAVAESKMTEVAEILSTNGGPENKMAEVAAEVKLTKIH